MSCNASCSGRRYGSIFSCSVPGRKPSPLAGLDCRPGQDDPRDLLGLQRLNGLGHGEVGLAGTGRADSEHDGVLVDGVDVAFLVEGLRPNRLAPTRKNVQGEHLGRRLADLVGEHADGSSNSVRGNGLPPTGQRRQFTEHTFCQRHVCSRPRQGDGSATYMNVGTKLTFYRGEILVRRPQDLTHGLRRQIHTRTDGALCGAERAR